MPRDCAAKLKGMDRRRSEIRKDLIGYNGEEVAHEEVVAVVADSSELSPDAAPPPR